MPPTSFRSGTIDNVVIRVLERQVNDSGWNCELFRLDEVPADLAPAMGSMSLTAPGVLNGPHEHRWQTDYLCFVGPARMRVCLWDNRPESPTYGVYQEKSIDPDRPVCVIVPPGVVHCYQNLDDVPSLVLNFPDRLYKGMGQRQPADEIRHDQDPFSPFKTDLAPPVEQNGPTADVVDHFMPQAS